MQSVEIEGLDQLLERWEALLASFPQAKAELLDRLGKQILEDVRRGIGGSGKVQGWQERYVGSKNGYAAVRPRAGTWQTTKRGGKYAVGYITNAIENGHRNRGPLPTGGKAGYRYRPRHKTAAAAGRHFYAGVQRQVEQMGAAELARLADEVARRLEGGV